MDLSYTQTKETYERSAEGLKGHWDSTGDRKRHIQLVIELSGISTPSVLELGCGPGRDAAIIEPLSRDYVGIDYANSLIHIAREKVPNGKFIVGDMVETPYPEHRNIVLAFASLLHLQEEDVKKVMQKVWDCLDSHGIFYISTKAGEGTTTKRDEHGVRTYYLYNSDKLASLAGNNFVVVHNQIEHIRNQDWTELVLKKVNR